MDDQPEYYAIEYMLDRGGLESVFGFPRRIEQEFLKAYFLGRLHGANEKKRFNPYVAKEDYDCYEKGFFGAWKDRMIKEGKDWTKEMDKV